MSIASNIAGRLHVSASNREVIRACWYALAPKAKTRRHRKARHRLYREALKAHTANRKLYRAVITGDFR